MEKSNKKFYLLVGVILILCAGAIFYVRGPLQKTNVATTGDTVDFTFSGTLEDGADIKTVLDPENSNTSWDKSSITIGDQQEPVQLEEALVDKKAGDIVENVEVTFEEGYTGNFSELAGKKAKLNLTVNEVNKCSDSGYGCYTVNNSNKKTFDKSYKEFEKASKKALDHAKKASELAASDKEKAQKELDEANSAKEDANSAFESITTAYDGMKIQTLKDEYTEKRNSAETTNNQIETDITNATAAING